jgi:hypothetical protein
MMWGSNIPLMILFPEIDQARLGEADALMKIEGEKLIPYAPQED